MTPAELPLWLRAYADRARARAAVDAANAMAQTYQGEVVRSMHGPAPSPPGTPPARRTGTLARSVRAEPAVGGGTRARSSVAPHTVYARIQQLGGTIVPVRAPLLKWKDATGWHSAKKVKLPARPYMVMPPARLARVLRAGRDAALRAVRGG